MTDEEKFEKDCTETAEQVVNILLGKSKLVAICVMPAVLATIIKTFEVPRDMAIRMMDSALEDIGEVV